MKNESANKISEENELLQNKIFVIENLINKRDYQISKLENEINSSPQNLSKSFDLTNPTENNLHLYN